MQILARSSLALLLAVLVSGCSSGRAREPERRVDYRVDRVDECKWNRSRCIYEGAYEPHERDYAEQEAARLNRAQAQRMRRGM